MIAAVRWSLLALALSACSKSEPAVPTPVAAPTKVAPPAEAPKPAPPPVSAPVPAPTPAAETGDAYARLEALLADPTSDPEGTRRAELCAEIGRTKPPGAASLLVEVLAQPPARQPAIVFREAITASGMLAAPAATDGILAAILRVPDAATTTSLTERARVALAAIGPPAQMLVLSMLQGSNARVESVAAESGIERTAIELTAMSFLPLVASEGDGTADAIRDVLATTKCGREAEQSARFAFAAQALGRLGDAKAVAPLCECVSGTSTPETGRSAAEALAFIGGDEAAKCLTKLIGSASWSPDDVAAGFEHELRWEAVRFAALAGGSGSVAAIRKAVVAEGSEAVLSHAKEFDALLAALERCTDAPCMTAIVEDASADPFAREAAAFELSRVQPRSADAAAAIARAFAVQDPDARLSMALLTRRVAERGACPACAEALRAVLDAEKGKMDMRMQAAVIEARATMAVVSPPGVNPFAK